jgi:hypothetical protein
VNLVGGVELTGAYRIWRPIECSVLTPLTLTVTTGDGQPVFFCKDTGSKSGDLLRVCSDRAMQHDLLYLRSKGQGHYFRDVILAEPNHVLGSVKRKSHGVLSFSFDLLDASGAVVGTVSCNNERASCLSLGFVLYSFSVEDRTGSHLADIALKMMGFRCMLTFGELATSHEVDRRLILAAALLITLGDIDRHRWRNG